MTRPVKLTLAALILVCAGSVAYLLLAPGQTDHPVATITLDGEVLDKIDLTSFTTPQVSTRTMTFAFVDSEADA